MNVEAEFLRTLYLGESLAPYRLLNPVQAVIPWDDNSNGLLDAEGAQRHGRIHLARWLADAERLWRKHSRSKLSFREQLDYYGKLSAQFPVSPLRLIYSASGSLPAAAVIRDDRAVMEHKLYWAAVATQEEAHYLIAILNSETARQRVGHLQSRGQWGARDFDKVMFSLPIPLFDAADDLHKRLARAAAKAEGVAGAVPVEPGEYFVKVRQRIRDALKEDGVAAEIDELVEELLGSAVTPA